MGAREDLADEELMQTVVDVLAADQDMDVAVGAEEDAEERDN